MIIDYVTGDRVVQDSDGTRVISYACGGFMVESAGLPPVTGSASGLTVEPMPGEQILLMQNSNLVKKYLMMVPHS